jgi:methionyl aminopeptidase
MVNYGSFSVITKNDGWTVVTGDGEPSAHFEHTICITNSKPEILTI